MTKPRILIAGIGNIFLGDDAFGVEVLRRLWEQPLPESVRAVDFGICGFDLACAILDGYEAVILVDTVSRGGPPGTLYVLEPELPEPASSEEHFGLLAGGHALTPSRVLQWAGAVGGQMPLLRVVGCEPCTFGSADQPQMGLSPAVAAAVDQSLPLIEVLIKDLLLQANASSKPETGVSETA